MNFEQVKEASGDDVVNNPYIRLKQLCTSNTIHNLKYPGYVENELEVIEGLLRGSQPEIKAEMDKMKTVMATQRVVDDMLERAPQWANQHARTASWTNLGAKKAIDPEIG